MNRTQLMFLAALSITLAFVCAMIADEPGGLFLFVPLAGLAVATFTGGLFVWRRGNIWSAAALAAILFGIHTLFWCYRNAPEEILKPNSLAVLLFQTLIVGALEVGFYMIYHILPDRGLDLDQYQHLEPEDEDEDEDEDPHTGGTADNVYVLYSGAERDER